MMDIKIKISKTKLGENISIVLPLIEEITKQRVMPLCLIGFSAGKNNVIHAHFATISNDKPTEDALYELCKHFVQHKEKAMQKNKAPPVLSC